MSELLISPAFDMWFGHQQIVIEDDELDDDPLELKRVRNHTIIIRNRARAAKRWRIRS